MKDPKIWCCICALFLIYAILILSEERQEIVFVELQNSSEPYDYSLCLDLKGPFFVNKTQLDLDAFNRELFSHYYELKRPENETETFYARFNRTILGAIRLRTYFFYKARSIVSPIFDC